MKKTLSLLFALLLLQTSIKAQKAVLFKLHYSPNQTYLTKVQMKTNTVMDFKGDSVEIKKMKADGAKLPIEMEVIMNMQMNMRTENKQVTGTPFVITYSNIENNVTMNGNAVPMPPNTLESKKAYGKFVNGMSMQIDSISGVDDKVKARTITMMEKFSSQIKFPDKPLKVGDKFTHTVPLEFQVTGKNIKINTQSEYTLKEVKDKVAYFDVNRVIEGDLQMEKGLLKMKGNGSGKVEYSIKESIISSSISDLAYDYTLHMGQMIMVGSAKSHVDLSVAIPAK